MKNSQLTRNTPQVWSMDTIKVCLSFRVSFNWYVCRFNVPNPRGLGNMLQFLFIGHPCNSDYLDISRFAFSRPTIKVFFVRLIFKKKLYPGIIYACFRGVFQSSFHTKRQIISFLKLLKKLEITLKVENETHK